MKKIISLVLALMLLCSVTIPVFAENNIAEGETRSVALGETIDNNYGTVSVNNGTVDKNYGTVGTNVRGVFGDPIAEINENHGTVLSNGSDVQYGRITNNCEDGHVISSTGFITTNNGVVDSNKFYGIIDTNNGTIGYNDYKIENNNNEVTVNERTITNNYGTVVENRSTIAISNNYGVVTDNYGTVYDKTDADSGKTGTVTNNYGKEIKTENGEEVTYVGVVVNDANSDGGSALKQFVKGVAGSLADFVRNGFTLKGYKVGTSETVNESTDYTANAPGNITLVWEAVPVTAVFIRPFTAEVHDNVNIKLVYNPRSRVIVTEERVAGTKLYVDGKPFPADGFTAGLDTETNDVEIEFTQETLSNLAAGSHNVRIFILGHTFDCDITI